MMGIKWARSTNWWCFKFSLWSHCCLAVHTLKALHSCKLLNPHDNHSWKIGQYYFLLLRQQILRKCPMTEFWDEKQERSSDVFKATSQVGGKVSFKMQRCWPQRALQFTWSTLRGSLTFTCLEIQWSRKYQYATSGNKIWTIIICKHIIKWPYFVSPSMIVRHEQAGYHECLR